MAENCFSWLGAAYGGSQVAKNFPVAEIVKLLKGKYIMNSEECCGQPEDCSKDGVTAECLVDSVQKALQVALQCKEDAGRSEAGRKAALTVTELEVALFRANQFMTESCSTQACA